MQASAIHSVAVVGAGLMGHGIAQDFATHGYEVRLYARSQERLDQALRNIQSTLALGPLSTSETAATTARIRTGTLLEPLVADADLVVEAISEDLALKQQLFHMLDGACPQRTILASTTSDCDCPTGGRGSDARIGTGSDHPRASVRLRITADSYTQNGG